MRVTAQNVNLAAIDALLLRPPILSGTLNASAKSRARRTRRRWRASSTWSGAFRQAHFDSLGGG
jgi:hypothetical protein